MIKNALAVGLALLLAATSIYASTVVLIKKPASAFCSTTGNTLWWRAEATDFTSTDGTLDNSAGDSNADTVSGAVTLNASAAKMGSSGILTVDADDYYTLTVSSGNIISGTQGTIAFWWRWPSGTINLGRIIEMRVDSNNHMRIIGSSTNPHLVVDWVAGGSTAGSAIAANNTAVVNTWYFVVVKYDAGQAAGSDVLSLYVYSAAGSLVTSDVGTTETLGPLNPTALRMGSVSGSVPVHIDQVMVWSTTTATPESCMNQANFNGS